jgi:hypothetical protein
MHVQLVAEQTLAVAKRLRFHALHPANVKTSSEPCRNLTPEFDEPKHIGIKDTDVLVQHDEHRLTPFTFFMCTIDGLYNSCFMSRIALKYRLDNVLNSSY